MIEILPNWHPIFVHYTVSLLSLTAIFFWIGHIFKDKSCGKFILNVAYLTLWLGGALTVFTLLAGWDAYSTVAHDTPSHAAMTDHKNWAFSTSGVYLVLIIWAIFIKKSEKGPSYPFLFATILASLLLGITGWKGGELVYRYGLGVMSLPEASVNEEGKSDGHNHSHGNEGIEKHSAQDGESHMDIPEEKTKPHNNDGHAH